ncbi:MAG: hypothetical protein AUH11_16320 [Acidobacteria bacterium 13_2_20CM_57_17]|nr:MAG: hypothetical protein AUH11_16320 [Acidobacteria bacterium 13_2_20CM_57_17]
MRGSAGLMAPCMATARLAEWDSAPLVPCIEIVKFPVVAFVEAPKTTGVLAPTVTLKGLAGFEVTPEGSALSVTWTAPAKPFSAFTETLTEGLVAPCGMEIEFDDKLRVKSGAGGGGGELEDAAPQPAQIHGTGRER